MDGQDRLDCFKLHHHAVCDEKIDAVSVIDSQIFVTNGDRNLLVQFVQ